MCGAEAAKRRQKPIKKGSMAVALIQLIVAVQKQESGAVFTRTSTPTENGGTANGHAETGEASLSPLYTAYVNPPMIIYCVRHCLCCLFAS